MPFFPLIRCIRFAWLPGCRQCHSSVYRMFSFSLIDENIYANVSKRFRFFLKWEINWKKKNEWRRWRICSVFSSICLMNTRFNQRFQPPKPTQCIRITFWKQTKHSIGNWRIDISFIAPTRDAMVIITWIIESNIIFCAHASSIYSDTWHENLLW